MTAEYYSIKWKDGTVSMIDQRLLPLETKYVEYADPGSVAGAIRDMVIRGAPALGAAGAYGLALAVIHSKGASVEERLGDLESAADLLRSSRPTAVNLSWAVDRVLKRVESTRPGNIGELTETVLSEAHAIFEEDARMCRQISQNGLEVVPDPANIIHHCNTGALATVAYGTALGVVRAAHEHGRRIFVYVDETRPRLQGARLTSWELQQLGIPHAIIADGASGYMMQRRGVDLALVGCDRIAANGDTANKVGTYNLALVARAHGVPFYVAGPTSTIDLSTSDGGQIEIEERDPGEVTHVGAEQIAPQGARALNPAFDVTPAEYITAIITEEGIARPPYRESLGRMAAGAEEKRQCPAK